MYPVLRFSSQDMNCHQNDFTLKNADNADGFRMTLNGEELDVEFNNGVWGFGTLNEGIYPYAVSYDDSSKTITWEINVPVENVRPVTLSYVLIIDEDAENGEYDTNVSAILDYKSTDGKKDGTYTFEKPKVTYPNSFDVIYRYEGNVKPEDAPALPETKTYKYGETVDIAAEPEVPGYTFSGWSEKESFEMPNHEVVILGSWTIKGDLSYIVRYLDKDTENPVADSKQVNKQTFGNYVTESAIKVTGYDTVKHGDIVDADDYAFAGPIQYPYNFEYEGQKYMLSGSYVAADGVYGDSTFEAKSDIDIIYTYSAIATYTVTYNFLDVETKAPVRDSASRSYEIMLGFVEQPYNFTKTVNANNTLDGYNFVRVEGDVVGSFNEENANKEINLYFEKIQPVVEEEPVVEEPIVEEPTKEPEIEEPVIEEPVVEQPEEIEEPEVPQAEPEIEEPTHKTRKTEKEDPIEETTSEETVENAEEIADEETPLSDFEEEEEEEIIADEDAPMAAFEEEAVEDTDIAEEPVLVNSPLTGDERHTAAWAGISLASLLGILFLERKKRMTE